MGLTGSTSTFIDFYFRFYVTFFRIGQKVGFVLETLCDSCVQDQNGLFSAVGFLHTLQR